MTEDVHDIASGLLARLFSPTPQGQRESGNLDPYARRALANPDGSYSSAATMSFGDPRGEVLIPTVINGVRYSPQDAVQLHRQTGEHFGIFDTPANADAYAQQLHERMASHNYAVPTPGQGPSPSPTPGPDAPGSTNVGNWNFYQAPHGTVAGMSAGGNSLGTMDRLDQAYQRGKYIQDLHDQLAAESINTFRQAGHSEQSLARLAEMHQAVRPSVISHIGRELSKILGENMGLGGAGAMLFGTTGDPFHHNIADLLPPPNAAPNRTFWHERAL